MFEHLVSQLRRGTQFPQAEPDSADT